MTTKIFVEGVLGLDHFYYIVTDCSKILVDGLEYLSLLLEFKEHFWHVSLLSELLVLYVIDICDQSVLKRRDVTNSLCSQHFLLVKNQGRL